MFRDKDNIPYKTINPVTRSGKEDKFGTLSVVIGNTTRMRISEGDNKQCNVSKMSYSVCEMGTVIGCAQFYFFF